MSGLLTDIGHKLENFLCFKLTGRYKQIKRALGAFMATIKVNRSLGNSFDLLLNS